MVPRCAPPHITMLSPSTCRKVTDEGVRALAERCSGLQRINLRGCAGVKEEQRKLHTTAPGIAGLRAHTQNPLQEQQVVTV